MPLLEMSPNIQETEPAGRKRSHDEFADDLVKADHSSDAKAPITGVIQPSNAFLVTPVGLAATQGSPQGSPALTEAGSSTPARKSASPETPTKPTPGKTNGDQPASAISSSDAKPGDTTNPAAKRKRVLTPAEKEARDKEAAEKKKEREEKALVKAAEKAKADEEKAARAKEKEEKRKKKEDEDREKAQQREEKKQKKEDEQRRAQEEKDKKARSQPKLSNFFTMPASSPKKANGEIAIKSESPIKGSPNGKVAKPESQYRVMFQPFFLKKHTRWATPIQMDEETREAKSQILDEFIEGERTHDAKVSFDPIELFKPLSKPSRRGRLHHPVKHIMEQVYKNTEETGSAGADEANEIIKDARKKLATIPMKVIAFSQDVRPPYYGTVTFKPFGLGQGNMSRLARRSMGRRLPLDYDYDSEAEWQDDEGEDLDMEDDEEELEDEDDMDGFLDDSEDAGLARRVFGNTIEPDSTGICFENVDRQGPNRAVYEHSMEFMHEGLKHSWGIDPFSTEYWEPEPKAKMTKASRALPSGEKAAKMPPPPAPANAFAALSGTAGPGGKPDKMVKDELLNDVKQAILDNKALSKVGIVDYIFQKFRDGVSRVEVKNTIEYIAEKTGAGRSKEWALKPGHEMIA